MKIVFIAANADRYGSDIVLRHIAGDLLDCGVDARVVLPEHGVGFDAFASTGVPIDILTTPVLRKATLNPRGVVALIRLLPSAIRSHLRLLRRERPDVVWVNTITIPLWLLLARLMGIRVVCHTHEMAGGSTQRRRVLYAPLFLADRILMVSEACRNDLIALYPRLNKRIEVLVNPSFEVLEPVAVQPGHEQHILILGRVSQRKGHAVLFDALSGPDLSPLGLSVHVCGDAYPADAALDFFSEMQQRAPTIPATIEFHGYVPTVEALALGGILVMPSIEPEACGMVVGEAIAARRRVIASDCGGVAEVAGGAALLVPPADADALGRAICAALNDDPTKQALEQAVIRRADELRPEIYLSAVREFAQRVAEQPRRGDRSAS